MSYLNQNQKKKRKENQQQQQKQAQKICNIKNKSYLIRLRGRE